MHRERAACTDRVSATACGARPRRSQTTAVRGLATVAKVGGFALQNAVGRGDLTRLLVPPAARIARPSDARRAPPPIPPADRAYAHSEPPSPLIPPSCSAAESDTRLTARSLAGDRSRRRRQVSLSFPVVQP